MAKEFFVTLNSSELSALKGVDFGAVAAYLYIKRNTDFKTATTRKICFGGLACYLENKTQREQAKRLILKLVKFGLLKEIEKQTYFLPFAESVTITTNTKNTGDTNTTTDTKKTTTTTAKNSSSSFFKSEKKEEDSPDLKEGFKIKEKKETGTGSVAPLPLTFGSDEEEEKFNLIKRLAIKEKILHSKNPKSDAYFLSAAKVLKNQDFGVVENLVKSVSENYGTCLTIAKEAQKIKTINQNRRTGFGSPF